jgi:hypothetical protein
MGFRVIGDAQEIQDLLHSIIHTKATIVRASGLHRDYDAPGFVFVFGQLASC